MSGDEDNRKRRSQWPPSPDRPYQNKEEDMKLWGILVFGFIGATATTLAVFQLRRTVDWVYTQLFRSQSTWRAGSGGTRRTSFQEEAWKRYNRRMQEEYEEELERVERIRRMQNVFNRERNKFKGGYESWGGNGQGQYHQHSQRDDWYWKTETSFRDRRSNYRETPREHGNYLLSQHYSILGLDSQKSALEKAFGSLPDLSKAVTELTVLKGVGPATASAVLAAYAPDVAPFMSDEAMVAALGNSKDYSLKQYLLLAEKLQNKAKELSAEGKTFTPSDVERALWSCAVGAKLLPLQSNPDSKVADKPKNPKKKRKR